MHFRNKSTKSIITRVLTTLIPAVAAGLALAACSPEPDVDEIMTKAGTMAADFQKAVTDSTMVQTIVNQGMKYRVVNHRLGGMYRMEVFAASVNEDAEAIETPTGVIISDGNKATLFMEGMEPREIKPGETKQYAGQMFWWESGVAQARLAGNEKMDGYDCHLLEVKRKPDESFYKLWVEKGTLAQIRSRNDSGGSAVEIRYSDFRYIAEDYKIPFHAEMLQNEKITAVIQIESVKINQNLSPDLFDLAKVNLRGGGE